MVYKFNIDQHLFRGDAMEFVMSAEVGQTLITSPHEAMLIPGVPGFTMAVSDSEPVREFAVVEMDGSVYVQRKK